MAEKISPAAEDRGATQTISFGLNGFVENTQLNDATQESIRAQIINSGEASAKGVTARGPSPVLALCRKLVEAGFDPSRRCTRTAATCLRFAFARSAKRPDWK
jgi:hypothetical protein